MKFIEFDDGKQFAIAENIKHVYTRKLDDDEENPYYILCADEIELGCYKSEVQARTSLLRLEVDLMNEDISVVCIDRR